MLSATQRPASTIFIPRTLSLCLSETGVLGNIFAARFKAIARQSFPALNLALFTLYHRAFIYADALGSAFIYTDALGSAPQVWEQAKVKRSNKRPASVTQPAGDPVADSNTGTTIQGASTPAAGTAGGPRHQRQGAITDISDVSSQGGRVPRPRGRSPRHDPLSVDTGLHPSSAKRSPRTSRSPRTPDGSRDSPGGTRIPASPRTPKADLSTYVSTSLKGTGSKAFEDSVPKESQPYLKATPESVAEFDEELNNYVKNEATKEIAVAKRRPAQAKVRTPELKFTDEVIKLNAKHVAGFIDHCENEKETGGDLICGLHVEPQLPDGKTRKVFAVIQVKVMEQFVQVGPKIDFTHENPGGLQIEHLAIEVQKKRGEFDGKVDVLGAFGVVDTASGRFVFMPLDEILKHFKGSQVDMTAGFSRQVTAELLKEFGKKGFLQEMLDYVEKHETAATVAPP
ncbi:hypothetical protein FRC17_002931 [Serendipita sp. 399]|nr:hypothetical protein FRC17_002931 [Serendipita sp. 399]